MSKNSPYKFIIYENDENDWKRLQKTCFFGIIFASMDWNVSIHLRGGKTKWKSLQN